MRFFELCTLGLIPCLSYVRCAASVLEHVPLAMMLYLMYGVHAVGASLLLLRPVSSPLSDVVCGACAGSP